MGDGLGLGHFLDSLLRCWYFRMFQVIQTPSHFDHWKILEAQKTESDHSAPNSALAPRCANRDETILRWQGMEITGKLSTARKTAQRTNTS
jgi:hypothetical protein